MLHSFRQFKKTHFWQNVFFYLLAFRPIFNENIVECLNDGAIK